MPKASKKEGARRLRRFFSTDTISTIGQIILLSPEESHHLWDTLRLRVKDRCLISDKEGSEAEAEILEKNIFGQVAVKMLFVQRKSLAKKKLLIHAYVSIPQKGKMEWIVEKAQELGADALCPLVTQRTVVRVGSNKKESVLGRWKKIAAEAVKQSGASPMAILPFEEFNKAMVCGQGDELVLFHPADTGADFSGWFELFKKRINKPEYEGSKEVTTLKLFFGPEGGFGREEVEMAKSLGVKIVSLGKNILRVETAAVSVLGAVRLLLDHQRVE